jgi:hypothetical protein
LPEFPTKIKVGHLEYQVIDWDNEAANEVRRYGEVDFITHIIRIRTDIPELKRKEILLHECLHVLWDYMNLPDAKIPEEQLVCNYTTGLFVLFKDNPDLKEFLFNA